MYGNEIMYEQEVSLYYYNRNVCSGFTAMYTAKQICSRHPTSNCLTENS